MNHVVNRGTDKRLIAMDNKDRLRFVQSLYALNDTRPAENTVRVYDVFDIRYRTEERERLVTVHAWCLMGNHYHMLLSEATDGGMSQFLQKFNIGYTRYFNLRHKRSGVLFQGKTKRVLIKGHAHELYILPYIHLNPLDLMRGSSSWRTQCIANTQGARNWIEQYRWSSYRNYTEEKEFVEVLEGSHLFEERKTHVKELTRFMNEVQEAGLKKLNLE